MQFPQLNLPPTLRRILFGALFAGAIIAIIFLLYVVFFRTTEPGGVASNQNTNEAGALPNVNELLANLNIEPSTNTETGLPEIDDSADGGLTAATSLTPGTVTQDAALGQNGDLRFYDPATGKFYKIDENGNVVTLGEGSFPAVEKVTWSNTTNETILEFPDGSNVYYDVDTGDQKTLPKEYQEFDFSETSNKIAFEYNHSDRERRVLAISNPDGSAAQTVPGGALGENADKIDVGWSPTGKVVATFREFRDLNRQTIGFVGLNNENFKGTIIEGSGFSSQYSPNGQTMLYNTYSGGTDYQQNLWVVGADGTDIGSNRRELGLRTTEDKCSFSNATTIYCGVPTENRIGSALEPSLLDDTPDEIYRVDLDTGLKTRIAVPVDENGVPKYTVDSLHVTSDEDELIFRDRTTGELVKIDL